MRKEVLVIMMNRYKTDLKEIEKCFSELKIGGNQEKICKQISRILTRMFKQNFKVSVCQNNTNSFFGMTIFPSVNTCETLISAILNNQSHLDTVVEIWRKNEDWNIEIDSILLFDSNLNANPTELVAILLHEIGHTMYSNSVPQRLFHVIRYELINIKMKTRNMFNNSKLKSLMVPSVIEACSIKMYKFLSTKEEMDADKFVVSMGYGEALNNFLEKLLRARGNSFINKAESEADDDIRAIFHWGVENIDELRSRKTKLKYQLNAQILKTPSIFAKDILTNIKNIFFGSGSHLKFNQLITESTIMRFYDSWSKDASDEVVLEFLANPRMGKLKKIDAHEIDFIKIKIDQIENHDDRIYLLDIVYHYLEQIELYKDYIETGKASKVPHSKKFIDDTEKELNELKSVILKTKIPERRYGVFIKYPNGYDG